jgi:oligopeptide/dipeptide ABC transporter ATP-binding protein
MEAGQSSDAVERRAPVLEVTNLCVDFQTGAGPVRVVDDVTFRLQARETLGIVGESGSGKSVTSLSLLGLIPRRSGRVTGSISLHGEQLVGRSEAEWRQIRGERIAMIFQEPMTSLNPAFKVGDQIAAVYRFHRRVSRRAARARAIELLELLEIPSAAKRAEGYPHEFSGGMRQRAMIAMALACDPDVLIADEPTTALDVTIQAQILEILRSLRAEFDMSLILVTHDLGVVADICDRVMVMYAGQAVEHADVRSAFHEPAHPYTEALLSATPANGARSGRLATIPGTMPIPGPVVGCRFRARCTHAVERCALDEDGGTIAWRNLRPDHSSRCIRAEELTLGTRT